MYMVRTRLCLYYFYILLPAEFADYFSYIFLYLSIYYLSSVLRCEYYVVFAPVC